VGPASAGGVEVQERESSVKRFVSSVGSRSWGRFGAALGVVAAAAAFGASDLVAQQAAAATTADPDTTIEIRTFGSSLEFEPSTIAAKQGTVIRIRLINEGTLPHNLAVVKDESDIDVLGPAAFKAKDTGYIPVDQKDRMYAWTDLAAPGETVEVTFTVPAPGEYWFVCLYPGHYNMMVGTLKSLN
jgi:uncharacterized cupredoxin-like copper-binding protein